MLPVLPTILTQDNRCTADPIFEVCITERIFGMADGYEDGHVWIENESGEHYAASPSWSRELDRRLLTMDKPIPEKWTWVGYKDIRKVVTTCFTEEGAKAYIKANGHNLHSGDGKPAWIYVDTLYRNQEMLDVRSALIYAAQNA